MTMNTQMNEYWLHDINGKVIGHLFQHGDFEYSHFEPNSMMRKCIDSGLMGFQDMSVLPTGKIFTLNRCPEL